METKQLLKDIQENAISSNSDISELLRKCLVLAYILQSTPFIEWINNELYGYDNIENLPLYRKSKCKCFGDYKFNSPAFYEVLFAQQISNKSIENQFYKDKIFCFETFEPIDGIREKLKQITSEYYHFDLPIEFIEDLNFQYNDELTWLKTWQLIPRTFFTNIIDQVKNKVLSLTLELEKQLPEIDQNDLSKDETSKEIIQNIFYTNIYAPVTGLNIHSNINNQNNSLVIDGDFESLKQFLLNYNIELDDIAELKTQLIPTDNQKEISTPIKSWIKKVAIKAGTGVYKLSESVAIELITKGIASYLGLR